MIKFVTINAHMKHLISELNSRIVDEQLELWYQQQNNKISRLEVIAWLKKKITHDKYSRYHLEILRLTFLHHLYQVPDEEPEPEEKPDSRWAGKLGFIVLAIAGTILAVCQGFDGIATLLGLFTSVPVAAIFFAGIAFAVLSLGVFYGFGLGEISKNLDVGFRKSREMLDIFVDQARQINRLRKEIVDSITETRDIKKLIALKDMVAMLAIRYHGLDQARAAYTNQLKTSSLKLVKGASSAMSAVLFFSGGYFAAQTLSSMVAGLFIAGVTPTFWPIVLASTLVGLAGVAIYWFVERPGFENLVGRWFGLDKDKIDDFADVKKVKKHKKEFGKLEKKIDLQISYQKEIEQLEQLTKSGKEGLKHHKPTPVHPKGVGFFKDFQIGDVSHPEPARDRPALLVSR